MKASGLELANSGPWAFITQKLAPVVWVRLKLGKPKIRMFGPLAKIRIHNLEQKSLVEIHSS